MADDRGCTETENNDTPSKKRPGILSRMLSGILKRDDFEKRLQYISKEEEAILARIKRRSFTFRRMAKNFIVFSVILEVVAVVFAIVTTRSVIMNWKMRALRILPMFLLPALSAAAHWAFVNFTKMRDRRDQKTLERLRAERQEKINELKERTNYYTTQQIIQRYDPDPAAKAAAATVLASKLGADSGLKVLFGDEPKSPVGRSNDVELVQSSGLRNRRTLHSKSSSTTDTHPDTSDHQLISSVGEEYVTSEQDQLVVNHHQPQGSRTHDGGWIARIAALLVGEDPTQSYALICGNCRMHNGLARKEDFPYVTYYCPHCHALNKPKQSEEQVSGSHSTTTESIRTGCAGEVGAKIVDSSASDAIIATRTSGFGEAPANVACSSVSDNIMTTGTGDTVEAKAMMSDSDNIITTNLPADSIPDNNEVTESTVLEDNAS